MLTTKGSYQILNIEPISSDLGFAEVSMGLTDVVTRYDYILHKVEPKSIMDLQVNIGKWDSPIWV